jgi:hypothetical protein
VSCLRVFGNGSKGAQDARHESGDECKYHNVAGKVAGSLIYEMESPGTVQVDREDLEFPGRPTALHTFGACEGLQVKV